MSMNDGHVLVMAAGADESRRDQLVARLAGAGLPMVVGPGVGGHPSWAQSSRAAALLLVVGGSSLPAPLTYPLEVFARRGQAVVVNLDAPWQEAPARGDVMFLDLGHWPEVPPGAIESLIAHLRALVASGVDSPSEPELDNSQVEFARNGVLELQSLTGTIGKIGEVLIDDDERSLALRQTLAEISGTYRVVKSAIESFVAAGVEIARPGAAAYANLGHGILAQAIRNGRGHCTRIETRYVRVGGLRDGLKDKVSPGTLTELDETFARLGSADGDVFEAMDRLGQALTEESRVILRYLRTERPDEAREHSAVAVERLLPLESALDVALAAFQEIESALGYAEPLPPAKEVVHMSTQNITILGSVHGSNIVAAGTIERSSITLAESPIGEELRSALLELHKATAALTTQLSDDEAALAARDLEDLTKEATSGSPRPAFWRRAADGLLTAAKKTAEVGIPVIELVTKVTALMA
jgi:hypothetical protein